MFQSTRLLLCLASVLVLCQYSIGLAIEHGLTKTKTRGLDRSTHLKHHVYHSLKRDETDQGPLYAHFHDVLLDTTPASAEAGAAIILSIFGDLCEDGQHEDLCNTTLPDLIAASANATAEHGLEEGEACNEDQDCLQQTWKRLLVVRRLLQWFWSRRRLTVS